MAYDEYSYENPAAPYGPLRRTRNDPNVVRGSDGIDTYYGDPPTYETLYGAPPSDAATRRWYAAVLRKQRIAQAMAAQAAANPLTALMQALGGSSAASAHVDASIPKVSGLSPAFIAQQQAAIAQQADTARNNIGASSMQGIGQINDAGTQGLAALKALAADAATQSAGVGKDVRQLYARQQAASGADAAALMADLARQGADVGTTQAALAQTRGQVGEQAARQQALQARLGQVLGANLNDRQEGVQQVTTGTRQALTRETADKLAQVEQARMNAMSQLQQQIEQAQRQADATNASIAAATRRASAAHAPSLSSIIQLFKAGQGKPGKAAKPIDYEKILQSALFQNRGQVGDPFGTRTKYQPTPEEMGTGQAYINEILGQPAGAKRQALIDSLITGLGSMGDPQVQQWLGSSDANDRGLLEFLNRAKNAPYAAQGATAGTPGLDMQSIMALYAALNGMG